MLVHEQLGIYKLRLPLPFKLNHINSYVIKGNAGWWIVDTGLNTQLSRQVWQQFFAEHAITASDIRGIYLTHFHPDHFGCAGWLQAWSGAPVYISSLDAQAVQRVWQADNTHSAEAIANMFIEHGMAVDLTTDVLQEMNWMLPRTKPHPVLTLLEAGNTVFLGDHRFTLIPTPGHSDGHICYFNQEYGVLLSGDHLLAKITSNISLWPYFAQNPLSNYLESLRCNRKLPCRVALPAHGVPFDNVVERIDQLLAHHKKRLSAMEHLAGDGATAYEICKQVFSQELSLHEMRFAMSETLAHLMYLVYQGKLHVKENGGLKTFCNLQHRKPQSAFSMGPEKELYPRGEADAN